MANKFVALLIWVLRLFINITPLTALKFSSTTPSSALSDAANVPADGELIFLQAIWRHGDRSPLATHKSDPHQEDSWPQGWGELSKIGMEQQFRLGQKLRRRYVHETQFLSSTYHNREIYVRSSDWNRTVMSAISNFIGFYSAVDEPITENNHDSDLPEVGGWPTNFLPIPVHTAEKENDYLSNTNHAKKQCIFAMVSKTPQYRTLVNQSQNLFQRLSKHCNQTVDDRDMFIMWDTLFIEKIYNRTQDWLTDELWAEIDTYRHTVRKWMYGIGLNAYNGVNFAVELPRAEGGPILWEMIEHMRTKAKCNDKIGNDSSNKSISAECKWINPLKYYAYSAHDETLAAIFTTFGANKTSFNKDENPYYATAVTVELWRTANGAYHVQVLLWDPLEPNAETITKQIVGCESGCDLEQFTKRSEPYRPVPDTFTKCASGSLLKSVNSASLVNFSVALILAGLSAMLWTIHWR